jgi:hypothetical protein
MEGRRRLLREPAHGRDARDPVRERRESVPAPPAAEADPSRDRTADATLFKNAFEEAQTKNAASGGDAPAAKAPAAEAKAEETKAEEHAAEPAPAPAATEAPKTETAPATEHAPAPATETATETTAASDAAEEKKEA